jgi:hypothetical protein
MTSINGVDTKAVLRETELRIDLALNGVEGVLPTTVSLEVGGVVMTQSAIQAKLSSSAQIEALPRLLRAQLQAAVAAKRSDEIAMMAFLADLKAGLVAHYGRSNPVLLQFGFAPYKKPAKRTTAKNAVATAKSLATRSARGTMGSRQKAAVQGEATPVVVTGPDGEPRIEPANSGPTSSPNGSAKTGS